MPADTGMPNNSARASTVRSLDRNPAANELIQLTGLSRSAVFNHLRTLTEAGTAVAVRTARSPKRHYRWVAASNP